MRVAVALILCISEYASSTRAIVTKMATAASPEGMRAKGFNPCVLVWGGSAIPNSSANFSSP
jgi:hypothetical protein